MDINRVAWGLAALLAAGGAGAQGQLPHHQSDPHQADSAGASSSGTAAAGGDDAKLIGSAMQAAPPSVAKKATIVAAGADGKMRTIRPGSNGFT